MNYWRIQAIDTNPSDIDNLMADLRYRYGKEANLVQRHYDECCLSQILVYGAKVNRNFLDTYMRQITSLYRVSRIKKAEYESILETQMMNEDVVTY